MRKVGSVSGSLIATLQRETCERFGVSYRGAPAGLKLGASLNLRDDVWPLNGLRHPPEDGTTGWFLWAGDLFPPDPDFFKPLHVKHLDEWRPETRKYLGLPPGWRFLIAPGYEDVWYDAALLTVRRS